MEFLKPEHLTKHFLAEPIHAYHAGRFGAAFPMTEKKPDSMLRGLPDKARDSARRSHAW